MRTLDTTDMPAVAATEKPAATARKEKEPSSAAAKDPPSLAVDTPAIPVDESIRSQLELIEPIFRSEVEQNELIEEMDQLEERLAEVKDRLSIVQQAQERLLETLPEALLQVRGVEVFKPKLREKRPTLKPSNGESGNSAEANGQDSDGSASETSQDAAGTEIDVDSLPWQERPTLSICKGVSGLGKGRIASLCEKFPLIGDLEAMRIVAAQEKRPFATKLPKGVGKAAAEDLTERLIGLMSPEELESAEEQAKRNRDKDGVDSTQEVGIKMMVKSLKMELEMSKRSGETGVLDSKVDSETWDDGLEAYKEGMAVDMCPSSLRDDHQLEWVRGWLAGELMDADLEPIDDADDSEDDAAAVADEPPGDDNAADGEYDEVDDEEPADVVADQPPGEETVEAKKDSPSGPITSEELNGIKNRIAEEGMLIHQLEDRSYWGSGYKAGMEEKSFHECLLSWPLDVIEDWLRGWLSGADLISDDI